MVGPNNQGGVEFLNGLALKASLLEERPFLKAMVIGAPDDPPFDTFRTLGLVRSDYPE